MPKKPLKKQPPKIEEDWEYNVGWHAFGAPVSEFQRHIYCARNNVGSLPQWDHFKWLAQKIAPQHSWNYWTDIRFKAFCEYTFTIWMAGGGTGKTTDAALYALTYWLIAPHETAIVVCSTTKEMLRARIWGQISRFFQRIPPDVRQEFLPPDTGDLLDSECFIRFQEGDRINVIKGVAVQDGPMDEAVNNIVGHHTTRVFWILDEMQGVRPAIMDAIPNLLKNPEPKFHGMGNPQSLSSLLCRYSEPKGGWKSIPKFTPEWEIDSQGYPGVGRAFFFDGRKSPAVLDPEWGKRNAWMLNQDQIDNHLNSARVNGDESHPDFMWQTIGWPPDKGLEQTVLDHSIIQTFNCQDKPVWTNGFVAFAALDPAYDGGDDAILQIMRRGLVKEEGNPERWVIAGVEQITVPISSESETPIDYQIVHFVRDECKRRNIPPSEFAVACAGRGAGLKSIFEMEWGPVNGVEEGGSPSERVVNERGKTAKESYNTRASELCFAIRDFALGNGLRGLPTDVADQACARLTFYLNGKWCVEPKTATKGLQQAKGQNAKGFKQRLGKSPDALDAWNIGLAHAIQKGAFASFGQTSPKRSENWNTIVKETNQEFTEYDEETDWRSEFNEQYNYA